jgi:hypothetical protein
VKNKGRGDIILPAPLKNYPEFIVWAVLIFPNREAAYGGATFSGEVFLV